MLQQTFNDATFGAFVDCIVPIRDKDDMKKYCD